MISNIPSHILRFFFLLLLQVLLLNNVQLAGYLNPQLYILFLLLLPLEINRSLALFLGFLMGFSVDIFTNTLGMHTAACVFLTFCRPFVITIISPRDGYEFGNKPTIQDQGFIWFISYSGVLVFLHHWFLFTIELFRISEFFSTLTRVLASSAFTLLLIIISQFFTYNRETRA